MRKSLLFALIAATALVPVAATAQEWQGRRGNRGGNDGTPRVERQRPDDGQRPGGSFESRGMSDGARISAPPPPRDDARSRPGFGDARADFDRARRIDSAPPASRDDTRGRPGFGDARADFDRARRVDGSPRPDPQGSRTDIRGRPGFGDARPDFDRARRNDGAGAGFGDARADYDRARRQDRDGRGDRRDRPVLTNRPDDGRRWNDDRRGAWNGRDDRRGWNGRGDWNYGQSWNRGWRGDNRYDWQSWRQRNRQAYRLPRYYAPQGYGFGYRRYSIGFTVGATLYARNYWIDDPWQYRLPDVYGPYRWVRYYNDAMLVDVYSGEVVDVIYDIFW